MEPNNRQLAGLPGDAIERIRDRMSLDPPIELRGARGTPPTLARFGNFIPRILGDIRPRRKR